MLINSKKEFQSDCLSDEDYETLTAERIRISERATFVCAPQILERSYKTGDHIFAYFGGKLRE